MKTCQKNPPSHLAAAPPDSELSLITPEIRFIPAVIFQGERKKKKSRRHGRVLTVFCRAIHSLSTAGNAGEEFRECDFSAEIKRVEH